MDGISSGSLTQISIHAPMKGATTHGSLRCTSRTYFNPRTHEGCDRSGPGYIDGVGIYFNPRTHEGCDRSGPGYIDGVGIYFNPRTHEGCDRAFSALVIAA